MDFSDHVYKSVQGQGRSLVFGRPPGRGETRDFVALQDRGSKRRF